MAVTETPVPAGRERLTVRPDTYRVVVDVALGMLALIVFSGAAVRLTGSGLGCPDWPGCKESIVPTELDSHVWIEYGNRIISAILILPTMAAAIGAYRLRPFRRDLVRPAVLLPIGVLSQGILGGITVIVDLHWQAVIAHYLLSMVVLVAAATLAWRVRREEGAPRPVNPRGVALAAKALTVYGALIIIAGTFATAGGPHAGGAGTGDLVARLSSIDLRLLIYLHGHPAAALGFAAVGVWFWARRAGATRSLRRALTAVCVLLAVQGIVGLVQYHTGLPAEVVWFHASLAAVLWISFVFAWLAAGVAHGRSAIS
jgi:cytochrome c oxidase assembly protein subunit 15